MPCRTFDNHTVKKYVDGLINKRLIYTEPTTVWGKDGKKRNGTLLYTIRPIYEAIQHHANLQLEQMDMLCNADTPTQAICKACVRFVCKGRGTTRPTKETPQKAPCCRIRNNEKFEINVIFELIIEIFAPKIRVENQAGESRVGCGCNLPAVTAAGNTGCKAVFEGFSMVLHGLQASHFGWVAIAQFFERWGAKRINRPC